MDAKTAFAMHLQCASCHAGLVLAALIQAGDATRDPDALKVISDAIDGLSEAMTGLEPYAKKAAKNE